jgi:hypothetical protein
MVDFFEMYKKEMSCQVLVGVFDSEEAFFDSLEPICMVLPDKEPQPHPEPEVEPDPEQEPNVDVEPPINVDDIEPDREPDMFDNPKEYVGANDEEMYGSVPPPPEFAQPSYNATNSEPPEFVNVEAEVEDDDPLEVHVLHDPENPKIVEGELFPDIKAFRKAIRRHAVKTGFAFAPGGKSNKSMFIAKCAAKGFPWRIHASVIWDKKTVQVPFTLLHMCVFTIAYSCFILHSSHVFVLVSSFVQIKKLSPDHNCPTTKLVEGKMASQGWCADRLGEWVKKNPTKGAKEAKEKLESDYDIKLKYSKAWSGLKVVLEQIHGTYEESFQLVFNGLLI